MKGVVDLVLACDGEALDFGYCADHHSHMVLCPDSLPEPSKANR